MNLKPNMRRYWHKTRKIIELVRTYHDLGDEALKSKTEEFRQRLSQGESLDGLLIEAYAVACEADRRVLKLSPYPVQIFGAVAMEYNNIIEMKTGEGKTLTATMIMYLHGLTGPGNFLITANSYLANRDAEDMGRVYSWLGLSIMSGEAAEGADDDDRDRAAIYQSDIVYTTNSTLGFDYLFDNLAATPADQFLSEFNFALLDEVDAVLLDTAQTPLIISGIPRVQSNFYASADNFIRLLKEDEDYEQSNDEKSVWFTEDGIRHIEEFFGIDHVLGPKWTELYRHLILALKAHFLFRRDRDYVIDDGELLLVDSSNGRELQGMKLEAGQHQALEAKEHLDLSQEQRTMAMVTYQNLFRMFHQLAGMTGTAATDAGEFLETYNLAVVKVPTNRPNIRKDLPDRLFISNRAKLEASLAVVRKAYAAQRPILIETGSLSLSNLYSRLLLREGIPHSLLNARSAAKEARIVKEAGRLGGVTVATSMAGRGTDIKLEPGATDKGGLLVLGTERMDNKRVDNQLRGRAGRQGDPGESVFYASLEDHIVVENAPKRVRKYAFKHKNKKRQVLSRHGRFGQVINRVQKGLSEKGRGARFNTLQYGEVFRLQRDSVYRARNAIMVASSLDDILATAIDRMVVHFITKQSDQALGDTLEFIYQNIDRDFQPQQLVEHPEKASDPAFYRGIIDAREKARRKELPQADQWLYFERLVILKAIDNAWIEQVDNLQVLKTVTMSRSTGQRNPIYEYQREAIIGFGTMKHDMDLRIVKYLLMSELAHEKDGTIKVNFP